MLQPLEMAQMYWRWLKRGAIYEIEPRIFSFSLIGQKYWKEVLSLLKAFDEKRGSKKLQ